MARRDEEGRDKEGFKSTLPVWIVEPGAKPGTIHVTCPRTECGGKAVLSKKRWQEGPSEMRTYIGRSCPYCFKTNRMPLRIMPKEMRKEWRLGEYKE